MDVAVTIGRSIQGGAGQVVGVRAFAHLGGTTTIVCGAGDKRDVEGSVTLAAIPTRDLDQVGVATDHWNIDTGHEAAGSTAIVIGSEADGSSGGTGSTVVDGDDAVIVGATLGTGSDGGSSVAGCGVGIPDIVCDVAVTVRRTVHGGTGQIITV